MFTFRKMLVPLAVFCVVFATVYGNGNEGRMNDNPAGAGDKDDNATVEYYEKLINSELEKALKYELPTNAKMHEPNDNVIRGR